MRTNQHLPIRLRNRRLGFGGRVKTEPAVEPFLHYREPLKTSSLGLASLNLASICSFTLCKLRFFGQICLASPSPHVFLEVPYTQTRLLNTQYFPGFIQISCASFPDVGQALGYGFYKSQFLGGLFKVIKALHNSHSATSAREQYRSMSIIGAKNDLAWIDLQV